MKFQKKVNAEELSKWVRQMRECSEFDLKNLPEEMPNLD